MEKTNKKGNRVRREPRSKGTTARELGNKGTES